MDIKVEAGSTTDNAFRKQLLQLDKLHWGFQITFAFLWLLLAINASLFPLITRSVETSLAMAAVSFIILICLILYYVYLYIRFYRK